MQAAILLLPSLSPLSASPPPTPPPSPPSHPSLSSPPNPSPPSFPLSYTHSDSQEITVANPGINVMWYRTPPTQLGADKQGKPDRSACTLHNTCMNTYTTQSTEALSLLGITEDIGYSFHSIAFPQQFVRLPQSLTGRMS